MLRIILLVLVAYAMFYSVISLIKALIFKQVKVHNFEKFKIEGEKVTFVKKDEDPKRFWILCLVHFLSFIALAAIVFFLVTL